MTDIEKKLTSCTKCGARPRLVERGGWWRVRCPDCNAAMHHEVPSPCEAAAQWNATTAHIKYQHTERN